MRKGYSAMLLFCLLGILSSCHQKSLETIVVSIPENPSFEIEYGLDKLKTTLSEKGLILQIVENSSKEAHLVLETILPDSEETNDGFTLLKEERKIILSSPSGRGLLYGLLDISETLQNNTSWEELESKTVNAHYPFRAIKFNLPWFSYRSGDNLSVHMETCRDLAYWEAFLNMMVENKFNTLTLWNLHPYMYMVKSDSFPEASPFTAAELAEWKSFWKTLFKMAKRRGIETYIVNWNIFVSEEFAATYNTAEYSESKGFWGEGETNELIERYTREMVTQTINEYEDLTGIGFTLGERMGGMTSEERKNWIDRTLIAGLKNADRPARLIYRAPLSAGKDSGGSTSISTEKITREAIENLGLPQDVWVEFKFNWSHAHSSPKVSIVHGGILTDTYWNPLPEKYKGVWTMRNEDFFVLRWAQPDFIRDFIKFNSQPYIGGVLVGSETYIPAKDYITKPEHRLWDYAFERQWLFYKVWGNLLYNSKTPDSYFEDALKHKFDVKNAADLLKAWKLASMNANRLASFYQGTWDATLYTEGFTTVGGEFIDVEELISSPVLDSTYVNIQHFVNQKFDVTKQITPLQLAETTFTESDAALALVDAIRNRETGAHLDIELTDIEAWAHHGKYFAAKLKGAVALAKYKKNHDVGQQKKAVEHLEAALEEWKLLTEKVEKYNVAEMPYQFDQNFSWRKHIIDVERDIELARSAN